MSDKKISVVVCARNEESRIEKALKSIKAANPHEIVVVDGNSQDRTVEIARKYTDKVIVSMAGSLTADRQVGIDAATCDYIAMIDADHRIKPDTLTSLQKDLDEFNFDVVQSKLGIEENSFWTSAENQAFDIFLNFSGQKTMIGTAPAMYRKSLFSVHKFDADITRNKDDADFFYRLSKHPEFTFGTGNTYVWQEHHASFVDYVKKFFWYGKGDSEFCRKHKNRAASMAFHLFINYPIFRSIKAILKGKPKAVPYFILCGLTRGTSMVFHLLKSLVV
ncbi:MAG: glycosyltransferase [Emcibacter sp.]|nr:glycosyltransferase [Emcibacter sp.]